jgi:hypothetical protein
MARRATLRASDADRERIAERLRQATAEGRLQPDELEDRLEAAFAARTYGELDALVADLPGTTIRQRERARPPAWLHPVPIVALIFLAPVLFSLLLAAAVVFTTLVATWAVLLVVGWFMFGRGRRYRCYYRRPLPPYTRWHSGRPGGVRPRPWV